jgi:DNA-binding Lrp family transcriptional regulator
MDEIDIRLCLKLLQNSRIPYSELADCLGLSVPAVHKRIQNLQNLGVIRSFTAKLSGAALRMSTVIVYGTSNSNSMDDLRKTVGKHELTYWVAIAGGNLVYVGAYLKDISQLDSFVSFLKEEASMPNPAVVIMAVPLFSKKVDSADMALSGLDYRVISSLHRDSRKAVSDVAAELGVSSKTVSRRLSRLVELGLIELSIEWYPDVSDDIISLFHLNLKSSAERSAVGYSLMKRYSPNALFFWTCINLPNVLILAIWTRNMKELKTIRERLQTEDSIESSVPNVLYTGYVFETWRDEWIEKMVSKKPRDA